MAQTTITNERWTLVIPEELFTRLHSHLFPGDHGEHGAIIAAGIARSARGARLLARDLFLATDGLDYVPGRYGHRMLTAEFVRDHVLHCRDEEFCYLAVHNHGPGDSVGFSDIDLASHERGYPALLDIIRGQPVGALVFASNAVAGDLWLTPKRRVAIAQTTIVGRTIRHLTPAPVVPVATAASDAWRYDRQTRLFGDTGQVLLRNLKVGVIGVGGAGSLLVEYLARLGVGHLLFADPERIEPTNVPRVVGSTYRDSMAWLVGDDRPMWLQNLGQRLSTPKAHVARRVARAANPRTCVEAVFGDFLEPDVAQRFTDCDYLFLAADSMQARLLFNAIVHQYLIPGVQVGAKVIANRETGRIGDVYSVIRPVTPESGCLWCNGLIPPGKLQEEVLSVAERAAQRYVDDPVVAAPSVITLNATAAAHAVNDFLFAMTGLAHLDVTRDYVYFQPREREIRFVTPTSDTRCLECSTSPKSRRARGDGQALPTRMRSKPVG